MKLSQKQKDELWGETGPYSQANLKMEARILDDKVSRIFLIIEVEINPLTFKVIKQNIKKFENDERILQLIEYAEYLGKKYGYVSCVFQKHYIDNDDLREAEEALEYSTETVIKMHKFVMELLK